MRGIDCKFYRNSAALGAGYATSVWNEVASVQDLEYDFKWDEFDDTTRAENGIKTTENTLLDVPITFMLRVPELTATTGDVDYDDFIAFETAALSGSVMDVVVLNGGITVTGSRGFRTFVKVLEFGESQKNGDGVFKKVTLKPAKVDAVTKATTATAVNFRYARVVSNVIAYATPPSTTFA